MALAFSPAFSTLKWMKLLSGIWALNTQRDLADRVVRLHVLANSDTEEDQALKLLVRDAVLERATEILEQSEDRKSAEALLRESLPELELYMDQVVVLVGRYLSFPPQAEGDDKLITASIVNNYVRMKIMPAPVKKKYSRVHLAYLLVICSLKQCLSIASIQKLMPVGLEEDEVRRFYTHFTQQYAGVTGMFARYVEDALPGTGAEGLPVSTAVAANLAKSLTEYLLTAPEAPEE